ncbi:MAG: hypothetical protein GF405_02985 [Candidatus Eisenbacteria bacterium]|nr:hypothetical protein [Candidatus Eisenbacteria bacterium]
MRLCIATFSVLLLAASLIGATAAAADEFDVVPGGGPAEVTLLSSGPDRVVLRLDLGTLLSEHVVIRGEERERLRLPGHPQLLIAGDPDLPVVSASLVIPDDARMRVRVLDETFVELGPAALAPSKGSLPRSVDPRTVDHVFSDVFERNAWYPEALVELGEPFIMRDVRGTTVRMHPVRWNPATGALRVWTSVTFAVETDGPGERNVLTSRPPSSSREFETLYRTTFLNYGTDPSRYPSVAEDGPMLIITNDSFFEEVAPLAQWKNQRGLETTVAKLTPIGRTPDDIKDYITSLYNAEGLAYVLLVGDDDQMPYFTYSGQAADPIYSLIAGSDSYPELFVARLSAESEEQVEAQVERWIEYERDPQPGADWYRRACCIASDDDGGTGTPDYVHMRAVRETLLGYTFTEADTLYDPGVTDDMIRDAVNDGRSLINYLGHGSTMGWSTGTFINNDVNSLVNVDMLPWIVSVACRTGQFTDKTCFAEVWMRATEGDASTGAVGIYASTVGMQWVPPLAALSEINHLLVTEQMRTLGGLCINGACAMIEDHGWSGEAEFKSWHLFGDPSLLVRSDTPSPTTAAHQGYVDDRQHSFIVQTTPGSTAALSSKGVLIGAAVADSIGVADVPIDGTLPEDFVTLTITRSNGMTLIQSLPVDDGTGIGDPARFALAQNTPNPFNPVTTIRYSVPADAREAMLAVYDVSGRHVTTLVDGPSEPGEHAAVWNGTDASGRPVASGVYLYRYEAGGRRDTGRMVLLK